MKTFFAATLIFFAGTGIAAAQDLSFIAPGFSMEDINEKLIPIPGTSLTAVVLPKGQGNFMIMTENQRYAVAGRVIDLWQRKTLDTVEDLRLARRVHFQQMGVATDDMAVVTVGTGPSVSVFVAPNCGPCAQVMNDIKPLMGRYTFHLIPIALAVGGDGQQAATLGCTRESSPVLDALVSHDYSELPAPDPDCVAKDYMRNEQVARMLGIRATPVIIAPNGEPYIGRHKNLRSFLEKNT